jgi:hypothetical protein
VSSRRANHDVMTCRVEMRAATTNLLTSPAGRTMPLNGFTPRFTLHAPATAASVGCSEKEKRLLEFYFQSFSTKLTFHKTSIRAVNSTGPPQFQREAYEITPFESCRRSLTDILTSRDSFCKYNIFVLRP